MEIDQLRTFLAVLEEGSFSRAGQVLGIGQSTVSFHVQALERAAGSRLVDRRRRQARPTHAGALLRRYARRLLALRDEALARLRREEAGQSGEVAIAASTIPAEVLLPPVLAAFRTAHPGVAIRVAVSDSRHALAALLAEECDLALLGAPPRDRRVRAAVFAQDDVVLVGPAQGPHALRARVTPARLAALPLILRPEGSGTRGAVERLIPRVRPSGLVAPVVVGSSEAARQCVLAGAGIAFLSRRAVAGDLARRTLRLLPLAGTPVRRRFYAARLAGATPAPAVRALLTLLMQENR